MRGIMDQATLDNLSREFTTPSLGPLLLHLSMAVVLGAIIAYRPWRKIAGKPSPRREMIHAQILIALAGAVAVAVIGDSLARAFGLVGLGGFIRFRTGIRDPRDAAVFFLLIGLGMACGLGTVGLALVCALFVGLVVMILDLMGNGHEHPYIRVTAVSDDPLGASGATRAVIETLPVTIRNTNLRLETKEIRFDLENPKGLAPVKIQDALITGTDGKLINVTCETLETLKGIRA